MKKLFGRLFKICLAIFLFCLISMTLYARFEWKDTEGISQFYDLDEQLVDVIFFGSSRCYCTVNEAILWNDYGIPAYNMGESSQNIGNTYFYMKEALKTQSPKYMLVEVSFAALPFVPDNSYADFYRNTINMKWSQNFFDNLDYSASLFRAPEQLKKEVFLKVPVIHSRYKELTQRDFQEPIHFKARYSGSWSSESYDTPQVKEWQYSIKIGKEEQAYLKKMIDLAEENDVTIGFFVAPFCVDEYNQALLNSIKEFANNEGVEFINFNDYYEEQGFDFATDMRAENHIGSHINNYGSDKITRSFGDYLKDSCGLVDKRGDEAYSKWDEMGEVWEHEIRNHQMSSMDDLESYIVALNRTIDTTYVISLNGDYQTSMADKHFVTPLLQFLEFEPDFYETGGIAVKSGPDTLFLSHGSKDYLWHTKLGYHDLAVTSKDGVSRIIFNNQDYKKVADGLNLLVYDNYTGELIDAVGFDAANGFSCQR